MLKQPYEIVLGAKFLIHKEGNHTMVKATDPESFSSRLENIAQRHLQNFTTFCVSRLPLSIN